MSSARIATLLRQRQLVAEHLAWLDAEILASATDAGPAQPAAAPAPADLSPPPAQAPAHPTNTPGAVPADGTPDAVAQANARADALLAEYRASETDTPENARRSCLLLTVGVALLGAIVLLAAYFLYTRR